MRYFILMPKDLSLFVSEYPAKPMFVTTINVPSLRRQGTLFACNIRITYWEELSMSVINCRMIAVALFLIFAVAGSVRSQETFTGTIISYGSGFNTRLRTGTFTLRINRITSD